MAGYQVASKGNKAESAKHTDKSGRRYRNYKVLKTKDKLFKGDFKNSAELKAYNGKLAQQNFGTERDRIKDIQAAFAAT